MDDLSAPSDLAHAPFDADVVHARAPQPSRRLQEVIAGLRSHGDSAVVVDQSALPRDVLQTAVAELGEAVMAWIVEETRSTVSVIEGHYPNVPDLPMTDIACATEATLLQICQALTGGPAWVPFIEQYRGFSREAARRGTHVRLIVDVMRVVQQRWVGALLAALHSPEPSDLQTVLTVTATVFDAAVDTILSEYVAAREQLLEGQLAQRRSLVQAVIDGDTVDAELIRRQLGIEIDHYHLGLLLWFPGMAAGYELERVAKQAAADFGEATVVAMSVDNGQMWAWISTAAPHPSALVSRLAGMRPSVPGVRVALGSIGQGPAGFRRTHLQARDTASVARAAHASAAVSTWTDSGLLTLLGHDLERARWFVTANLGPLSRNDAQAAEQRATLRSYLESNHSLVHTATVQHVHRNTVVYRIRKIEEALGYSIAERHFDLYCAVLLADYFGARVLHT